MRYQSNDDRHVETGNLNRHLSISFIRCTVGRTHQELRNFSIVITFFADSGTTGMSSFFSRNGVIGMSRGASIRISDQM
jgi:hypothetical protein